MLIKKLRASLVGLSLLALTAAPALAERSGAEPYPRFAVDARWPAQLPNNYILGNVGGISVDAKGHVWVASRPRSLQRTDMLDLAADPPAGECCIPAPAVMEFDTAGNYVRGWGPDPSGDYQWPEVEHGITVDHRGHVWVCGSGPRDHHCLKFTADGKFLLQIGAAGRSKGSGDKQNLNRPAEVAVWPDANEVFVADGYANRRVIVFDADTGEFKRMWGAYGQPPDDAASRAQSYAGEGPRQFNTVHCLRISSDGLVYVCDRANSRIQVFTPQGRFVREAFVARATKNRAGTAFSVAFSSDPQQQFLYVSDSVNFKIRVLRRADLQEIPSAAFGHGGPYAGQFQGLHVIATDANGNLFTSESDFTGRVQKFVYQGLHGADRADPGLSAGEP